jgi:hypothetical protein
MADQELGSTAKDFLVKDKSFLAYVEQARALTYFLYQEAVPLSEVDSVALHMGNLNALYYGSHGRTPTVQEWNQVEKQTQTANALLSKALRRKFLMSRTPSVISWMPIYLLVIAASALIFAVATIDKTWGNFSLLSVYLIWLGMMGAIGAFAFVGMNLLNTRR